MGRERGSVHMLLSQVVSALFDGPLGPVTWQPKPLGNVAKDRVREPDFWMGLPPL